MLRRLSALGTLCFTLVACHASGSTPFTPVPQQAAQAVAPHTVGLTLNVRVLASQLKYVSQLTMCAGAPGVACGAARIAVDPRTCPTIEGDPVCTEHFAPSGLSEVDVATYYARDYNRDVRGVFGVTTGAGSKTLNAVVTGSVPAQMKSIAVIPSAGATLALGQTEQLFVNASDASGALIVGRYAQPIHFKGVHLTLTPATAFSSNAYIQMQWAAKYTGFISGSIFATGAGQSAKSNLAATTGLEYFTALGGPKTYPNQYLWIGPITHGPDGKIYYGTVCWSFTPMLPCGRPVVGRIDPKTGSNEQIALPRYGPAPNSVDVTQLRFTSDGALWISVGVGPPFRVPKGKFYPSAFEYLPASFGAVYGVTQGANGRLWMSGSEYSGGRQQGFVESIPISGPFDKPTHVVALPACSNPYVDGASDIGYLDGSLYVLGPSSVLPGSLWKIDATTRRASCVPKLPDTFDPGLNMASNGKQVVFGIGGTSGTDTNRGFATLSGTAPTVSLDSEPPVNPFSLSFSGSTIYYSGLFDGSASSALVKEGVGTYDPQSGNWRFWPLFLFNPAGFNTLSSVDVASDGTVWVGAQENVARMVFLNDWSLFPQYDLPQLDPHDSAKASIAFGAVASPDLPRIGPFTSTSKNPLVCSVRRFNDQYFHLKALRSGACVVTVTDGAGHSKRIVANVK